MEMSHPYIDSDLIRESFVSREERMSASELRGELIVGAAFVLAAGCLALLAGSHGNLSAGTALLYVLCIAAVSRVRFDFGAGFTVPLQLVFVPMLFLLPVELVPSLVALGLLIAKVPDLVAARVPASRLLSVPGNSWFAVGPATVLYLADDTRPLSRPAILVLAFAAQLACDLIANAVRERMRGGLAPRELIDEFAQIALIDLALSPLGLLVAFASLTLRWAVVLVFPLLWLLRRFSLERHARLEQLIELNDAYRGTALLLGDVVEADDTYTGEHCRGVVQLAVEVAEELQLDGEAKRRVEFAALLHDVGKISVPKEIVNKAGPLDEREWEIIRRHTIEGQGMLDRVGGFMSEVGAIVRSSHERWDGGGYPDGLAGELIPLEARIVACCDAYNAMTTTRSYRSAMPPASALAELIENSGTQFDPRVVVSLAGIVGAGDEPAAELQHGEFRAARTATAANAPGRAPAASQLDRSHG